MIRKAGLMSTIGSTLGTIETVMLEATKAVEIISTYNSNWQEARELDLAKARFERDIEWMKLGLAVQSTSFDESAVKTAKDRYCAK